MLLACIFQTSDRVVYEGKKGPGKGHRIVFLAGDEEYRSEEGLPQLAKILALHHGFTCTVLFSLSKHGEIDPNVRDNQPGMEALEKADLCIMLLRFRCWPDAQMKHFVDYYLSGKPIIALRTSTHAFDYPPESNSPYRKFGWQSKDWPGGFGKQVLGETWVSHWGDHGREATHGILEESAKGHPILKGVGVVFGTTDVYEAFPPADATVLIRGEVVGGMLKTDPPAAKIKKTRSGIEQEINKPMMPIVWIRKPINENGKINRVFTTTMGAATDLLDENLRRLLVNAAFWSLGLEKHLSKQTKVDLIGEYKPSNYGFEGFKKGVKPGDL